RYASTRWRVQSMNVVRRRYLSCMLSAAVLFDRARRLVGRARPPLAILAERRRVLFDTTAARLRSWGASALAQRARRQESEDGGAGGERGGWGLLRANLIGKGSGELAGALVGCRAAFVGLAVASGMQNLLMLIGPLFMLQVYDRVLPSRSVPTLIGLGLLALILFCLFGVMDALRARILNRIARAWHEQIGDRVFDVVLQSALRTGNIANGIQPLRDLETLRAFVAGVALTALFDLPWMPLYVGI